MSAAEEDDVDVGPREERVETGLDGNAEVGAERLGSRASEDGREPRPGTSSRIPNAYVRLMNPAPTIPIPTDISPSPSSMGRKRGVARRRLGSQVLPSGGTVRSMR